MGGSELKKGLCVLRIRTINQSEVSVDCEAAKSWARRRQCIVLAGPDRLRIHLNNAALAARPRPPTASRRDRKTTIIHSLRKRTINCRRA